MRPGSSKAVLASAARVDEDKPVLVDVGSAAARVAKGETFLSEVRKQLRHAPDDEGLRELEATLVDQLAELRARVA